MGATYDALLRAVLESPDDDVPRLVLADWLEEHRREREGVELRRAVHTPQHVFDSLLGFGPVRFPVITCRGFVEQVSILLAVYLNAHVDLFSAHPITAVYFSSLEPADVNGDGRWSWYVALPNEVESDTAWRATLPAILWHSLDENEHPDPQVEIDVKLYPTKTAAELALSRAAVNVGRKAAGLPAYPWPTR